MKLNLNNKTDLFFKTTSINSKMMMTEQYTEELLIQQEEIAIQKLNDAQNQKIDAEANFNIVKNDYDTAENNMKIAITKMGEFGEIYRLAKIQELAVKQEIAQIEENKKAIYQLREVEALKQKEIDAFNEQERIRLEKHNRILETLSNKEQHFKEQIFRTMNDDDDDRSIITTTTVGRQSRTSYNLNATFQQTVRLEVNYRGTTASIFKTEEGNWKKGQWKDEHDISYKSPRQFWIMFAKSQGLLGKTGTIWDIKNRIKAYDEDGSSWDIAVNKDRLVVDSK